MNESLWGLLALVLIAVSLFIAIQIFKSGNNANDFDPFDDDFRGV